MMTRKTITYLPEKKLILLTPGGLSLDEINPIKLLGPKVRVYNNDTLINERNGMSYCYYEDLIPKFDNFDLLMFIKNPYWRILEVYLWKYLYYESYGTTLTKTFKKEAPCIAPHFGRKQQHVGDVQRGDGHGKGYSASSHASTPRCHGMGCTPKVWCSRLQSSREFMGRAARVT